MFLALVVVVVKRRILLVVAALVSEQILNEYIAFELDNDDNQLVKDENLMHLWPTRHAHINVYGKYHFEIEHIGKKRPFRSLRQSNFQP